MDESDSAALAELARISPGVTSHKILHYLYFRTRSGRDAAARELRRVGFDVEERLGADGKSWLVLARQDAVVPEEAIPIARPLMESLARQHLGEYDGWEAQIG